MVDKITKSIITLTLSSGFYEGLLGILMGVVIAISPVVPDYLQWCVIIVFLMITLVVVFHSMLQRRSFRMVSEFSDHPSPSAKNIATVGWQSLIFIIMIGIATYIPTRILLAAHIVTISSWIQGVTATAIWFFSFQVFRMFTTEYLVVNNGILIYQAMNSIFLPFDHLTHVSIIFSRDIPLEKRLRVRSLFILGIRSFERFVVIKWKPKISLIENFVPEIYLTPTDPPAFYTMIQDSRKDVSGYTWEENNV